VREICEKEQKVAIPIPKPNFLPRLAKCITRIFAESLGLLGRG